MSTCREKVQNWRRIGHLIVTIDSELKIEEHISNKVSKANSITGLIRRSFAHLDGPLFKRLYTIFVRPHLECAQAEYSQATKLGNLPRVN